MKCCAKSDILPQSVLLVLQKVKQEWADRGWVDYDGDIAAEPHDQPNYNYRSLWHQWHYRQDAAWSSADAQEEEVNADDDDMSDVAV